MKALVDLFRWRAGALFVALFFVAPALSAEVRHIGEWPEDETISLTVSGVSRDEAVRRLAKETGWSLVAEELGGGAIALDVRNQPSSRVLDGILGEGTFVVERAGTLVSVRRHKEQAPVPPIQAVVEQGEDLFVTGEGHVKKGDVVREVFVWRGRVLIEGTVTGSVVVFGGEARLTGDARVREEVITFGGALEIEDGAKVEGDVAAVFGKLTRGERAEVHCVTCGDKREFWESFFEDFFGHLTGAALLWLLGAGLVALAPRRVEVLRVELERRPLRSLAFGFGALVGVLLLLATLVVTLIGIPLALLSAAVTVIATYLGFCVLLLVIGRRLTRSRSENPYLHLGIGCLIYFLLLLIPGVGGLLGALGALGALGGLVATRGATRATP